MHIIVVNSWAILKIFSKSVIHFNEHGNFSMLSVITALNKSSDEELIFFVKTYMDINTDRSEERR